MSTKTPPEDPVNDAIVSRASTVRIVLVDDHPITRRGLREILEHALAGATVRETGSGGEALALVRAHRWSAMILDLSLPDGSGLDVLKRVRQIQPRLPVLIFSIHAAEQFARRAIAAGASGYLSKDSSDEELVAAVMQVLRGGRHFGADVLERVAMGLHPDGEERPHERLSDREYQVLRMIGGGKTVSQIASELALSVKTISTYRNRILTKMGCRTNAELMYYVLRHDLDE